MMSQRAHLWIRLVALGVLVALSCLPRSGSRSPDAAHTVEVARR